MGLPEAPGRLGGVGSVSAPRGRVRLAGLTLGLARSFRERLLSACCVPCALLGAHRAPRQLGATLPGRTGQGDLYCGLFLPSVSPVPWKSHVYTEAAQ